MWLHAGQTVNAPEVTAPVSYGRTLAGATLAQLSNPKAIVVYGSVFAALLPSPPIWMFLAIPSGIFTIETGWYLIVAVAFSASWPCATYARASRFG